MKMAIGLIVLSIIGIFGLVNGETKCFSVVGQLLCNHQQDKHMDVEIHLMDYDGALNPDDTMGWTTTDENGKFKIEGCGYDFLSRPDPYLRIWHHCRSTGGITKKVRLYPVKFAPETINASIIRLD